MVPLPRSEWCTCKPGVKEMVVSRTGEGLRKKEGGNGNGEGDGDTVREFEVKEEIEFPPGIAMAPRHS